MLRPVFLQVSHTWIPVSPDESTDVSTFRRHYVHLGLSHKTGRSRLLVRCMVDLSRHTKNAVLYVLRYSNYHKIRNAGGLRTVLSPSQLASRLHDSKARKTLPLRLHQLLIQHTHAPALFLWTKKPPSLASWCHPPPLPSSRLMLFAQFPPHTVFVRFHVDTAVGENEVVDGCF